MNYNELLNLIEVAEKSSFKMFEVNFENTEVRLSKLDVPSFEKSNVEPVVSVPTTVFKQQTEIVEEKAVKSTEQAEKASEEKIEGNVVASPIVGTFYSSPSTDKPNFVKVGDTVKEGDVLCIVEAMKVMNEVKSKYNGVVKKVLLENESIVEYNQPLFVIG